ncbi:MAG: PadR family transcriptional regulator [Bacteroidetes bacterium]|nr:MAG: PadR family transcriptional regulator [Bacteroidota bacterium]
MVNGEGAFPSLALALLGLVRDGARHGYAMYREWNEPNGLGAVWRIKQSRWYALLARLEASGYLTSTVQPQGGRPPRKVFRLTPAGRDAYLQWVRSPVEHGRQFRLEFLAKLHFARKEGPGAVADLIDRQRAVCRGWLEEQQAHMAKASPEQSFLYLVHRYRAGQVAAMLDWLDACAGMPDRNAASV